MQVSGDQHSAAQQRLGVANALNAGRMRLANKRPGGAVGPGSTVRLALQQLRRSRALLALLALGMLGSNVIACTIPLYNAFIGSVELQHTLITSSPSERNLDAFA